MFAEIFRFECRVQGKSPLFAVVALVFLMLAYLAMAAQNVRIGGGTDNLDLNAPFTIVQSQLILSIVAMFGCAAFIAVPLTRDAELKTAATFGCCSPVWQRARRSSAPGSAR